MKRFIWWTAAGLLAVLILCGTLTCSVSAAAARNGEAGDKLSEDSCSAGGEERRDAEKESGDTDKVKDGKSEDVTDSENEAAGREEKSEPVLTGWVLHTKAWEQNRQNANQFYKEQGSIEKIRASHMFWSGEKFILQAVFEGEKQPGLVHVRIKGTEYEARLLRSEGVYKGELFDERMLYRWGQSEPEPLTFLFEAESTGEEKDEKQKISYSCSVLIDDRQPYWLLHRKQ